MTPDNDLEAASICRTAEALAPLVDAIEAECDPPAEPEPEWCSACNGSGLGRPSFYGPDYDRCHYCNGHGYQRPQPEPNED